MLKIMLILWKEEEEKQIFEAVKQANFSSKNEENDISTNFFLIKYVMNSLMDFCSIKVIISLICIPLWLKFP